MTDLGACHGSEHCITCGDIALEMTVLRVDEARELALCAADDGRRETVEIALVAPVRPAERLLVHAGTAIAHQGGVL
ncbi:MAG: HypC/HybG/HupF family hydrogenase formation chaperone [Solirubrobacteraceae bacterium]